MVFIVNMNAATTMMVPLMLVMRCPPPFWVIVSRNAKGVAEVTRVPLVLPDHTVSGNVVVGRYQVA